jgi:hypothetical protein
MTGLRSHAGDNFVVDTSLRTHSRLATTPTPSSNPRTQRLGPPANRAYDASADKRSATGYQALYGPSPTSHDEVPSGVAGEYATDMERTRREASSRPSHHRVVIKTDRRA